MSVTPQAQRSRGPRSDVDVRELILDVTEAMAGKTNPDAVTLRAIAREADVAPRALSYHFANKRSLLEAVIRRRSGVISISIKDRLLALRERGDGVTVRETVDAMLQPMVELIEREPVGGVRWMRIYLTLSHSEDSSQLVQVGFDPEVAGLFFEVAHRALGKAADAGSRHRLRIGVLSMLDTLARADQPGYGRPLRETGLDPDFVEQLAIFTSAGIAGLI